MLDEIQATARPSSGWLDKPIFSTYKLNLEILIFGLLLIAAVFTRFYMLEPRVMSHDENSHVYFSWMLYRGQGYSHDPVTHGPFQFHVVALSYFLFGDNDLTARIPAALFSIATVAFAWLFRRYLGRYGALAAGVMLLISPFLLYYGRYVRNEAFVGLFGLITLWGILRYLETGRSRYLYILTAVMVLHFTTKETSFIYTAQALLFAGLVFVYRLTSRPWAQAKSKRLFIALLMLAVLFLVGAFGAAQFNQQAADNMAFQATAPVTPETFIEGPSPAISPGLIKVLYVFTGVSLLGAALLALLGYGLEALRRERAWDLMILLGTLVLPQLSPFIINFIGWKLPVSASEVNALTLPDILRMGGVIIPITLVTIVIGLWWDRRKWLISAGIWYGIFTIFYTTFFTNGAGFFTGLVGSLGYWLAQQEVNRGSQPWYYYAALQLPIYEYLAMITSILAIGLFLVKPHLDGVRQRQYQMEFSPDEPELEYPPVLALLSFWSITSLLAYTIAGEKMPWLTFHIALPMILLSGWFIGYLLDSVDRNIIQNRKGWLVLLLLPITFIGSAVALSSLLGSTPPFKGQEVQQLAATSTFSTALLSVVISGYGLFRLIKNIPVTQTIRLSLMVFLGILAILTARTAFTASYINYDNATEYMVYAHSGPGSKLALKQIEELSRRTTGTLDIAVAYDNDTTYPFWWYLRNFPNAKYYGASPTRDLRESPVILVGESNYGKIEPIVGQAYNKFEYARIWWPDQDYYNLTWERIGNAIKTPAWRDAIFRIWFYRDYTAYAQLTGKDMSLENWQPSNRMRLYIRKDVAASLWNFGTVPTQQELLADPYEGKGIELSADQQIGGVFDVTADLFKKPRNLAIAADGTFYVADTEHHRIVHLDAGGNIKKAWGTFADASKGEAPGGTFYEPWSVAIGQDGAVFVADTWNHRIQKFSPAGEFITMWGYFGQAETPTGFWGPRSIVIDQMGRVFISDTGNKRIAVFDEQGNFIAQYGTTGMQPGEFNEPTGLALSTDGTLYVADTWNQRIQSFTVTVTGNFTPITSWDIVGWYGQSLDNKPYLVVAQNGHVFASDPEGARILEFSAQGDFLRYWGDYGSDRAGLNLPIGLAIDGTGALWVADSGNNRLLRFVVPPLP